MIFFGLVILSSLWIWKILFIKPLLGFFIIAITFLAFLFVDRKIGKLFGVLIILFSILAVFQLRTTSNESLFILSNDDIRIKDMRLREYPSALLRVGYWFEEKKESIAVARIQTNFLQTFDLNQYFFTGHPRERVGISEFEKFPYLFLPLFIIGLIKLIKEKKCWFLFLFFLAPLAIISFIGHKNTLGEFVLIPFMVVSISDGLRYVWPKKWLFVCLYIFIFVSVMIQVTAYAQF